MDADNDLRYYRLMQAWKQNDNIGFNFYDAHDINNIYDKSEASIKAGLQERLRNTKVFVLLVGDHTKYLYRYVRWEIEQAMGTEVNFIKEIEYDYLQLKTKLNSSQGFMYFAPVKIFMNSAENDSFVMKHYMDKKNNHRTQFLYCRNGVRVYYSDVDILMMLLQIEDVGKQEEILNALLKWLKKETEDGYIEYGGTKYLLQRIEWCVNGLEFHTLKDIDVPEEDVIALINMIVAKDVAATETGNARYDFAKKTINKYIALLKWYWFKNESVEAQLKSIGYRTDKDLITNFPVNRSWKWKDMDLRFQEINVD